VANQDLDYYRSGIAAFHRGAELWANPAETEIDQAEWRRGYADAKDGRKTAADGRPLKANKPIGKRHAGRSKVTTFGQGRGRGRVRAA
jgi:hypothetical protein